MGNFTVKDGDKVLLEDLAYSIQKETDVFLKNDMAFLAKGNKQAAKRARVASLNLSKLTKQYRAASMRIVSESE